MSYSWEAMAKSTINKELRDRSASQLHSEEAVQRRFKARAREGRKGGAKSATKLKGRVSSFGLSHSIVCCLRLTRFRVIIALLFSFGMCMAVPGLLMRLEAVPDPSPFIQLNMCFSEVAEANEGPGAINFYGATQCGTPRGGYDELRIPLHPQMLVSAVSYIPRVLTPSGYRLKGQLDFTLKHKEKPLVTERLIVNTDDGTKAFESLPNGQRVQLHKPVVAEGDCRSDAAGCDHTLQSAMMETIFPKASFKISSSETELPLEFVSDLSLLITDLRLTLIPTPGQSIQADGSGEAAVVPPALFVSFHQYELTFNQAEGVKIFILGVFIAFFALAWYSVTRQQLSRGDSSSKGR